MSSQFAPRFDAVLRRDRAIILAGITMVAIIAWCYLFYLARKMGAPEHVAAMGMSPRMAMPQMHAWGAVELLLLFLMWAVMMVAMMVPSVTPLILTFARAIRRLGARRIQGSAGILLLGYLLAWTGFSALVALTQWILHAAAVLSPMMVTNSPVLAGLLLVAAGAFQFTSLKQACLLRCRSPFSFLMTHWRGGWRGTLLTGMKHGAYCVGCCWMLMAILFVTGVMNLLWVALIALFILAEKIAPGGEAFGRLSGVALIAGGALLGLG